MTLISKWFYFFYYCMALILCRNIVIEITDAVLISVKMFYSPLKSPMKNYFEPGFIRCFDFCIFISLMHIILYSRHQLIFIFKHNISQIHFLGYL